MSKRFADVDADDIAKVIFEGVIVHDGQHITDANVTAARMFGFDDPASMIGHPYQVLLCKDGCTATESRVKQRRDGNYTALCRRTDDSEFMVEVNAVETEGRAGRRRLVAFRQTSDEEGLGSDETGRSSDALSQTIKALASTIEQRDTFTAGHQSRVSAIAGAIAQQMNATNMQVATIRIAANIHDIGKISVPAAILMKPTALTKNEFNLVKEHPGTGYEIIEGIDFIGPVSQAIMQHHERVDGSGYPTGTTEPIFEARVLAVADVFDALTSARPYRSGMPQESALQFMLRNEEDRLDPEVLHGLRSYLLN
jgi:HD-GYP domain-containing protein (c-di-GMP phosphodiesterase class II)